VVALSESRRHPHLERICHQLRLELGLLALVRGRVPHLRRHRLGLLAAWLDGGRVLTVELAERVRILVARSLDLARQLSLRKDVFVLLRAIDRVLILGLRLVKRKRLRIKRCRVPRQCLRKLGRLLTKLEGARLLRRLYN